MNTNFDKVVANEVISSQSVEVAAAVSSSGAQATTKKGGVIFLTAGAATALTIPAPTAGAPLQESGNSTIPPPTDGDDGTVLTIISTTAFAHTVTAGANKLNGNKVTATFGAAAGNGLCLVAYNGVWYIRSSVGITLT